MDYRDRSLILIVIGVLLLLAGLGTALLGPLEMYCFYLFSEGGPFHYPGFGFGSFMFGNIAAQIIGYYLIAALLIPLGYGHVRLRRWARTLAVALCWAWLVVGAPLTLVFLFVLFSSKDLSLLAGVVAMIVMALSYLVLPWLLIRFYNGHNVRRTFEVRDPNAYWTERLPMPVLVLGGLFILYAVVLHVPIFFRGMFPFFGIWLTDLQGISALATAILLLLWLAWSMLRQRTWAWWAALVYLTALIVSAVVTLVTSSYAEILSLLRFPPTEVEILRNIPLQGYHLALFFGLPLLLTWGVIALSKRHFGARGLVAE